MFPGHQVSTGRSNDVCSCDLICRVSSLQVRVTTSLHRDGIMLPDLWDHTGAHTGPVLRSFSCCFMGKITDFIRQERRSQA